MKMWRKNTNKKSSFYTLKLFDGSMQSVPALNKISHEKSAGKVTSLYKISDHIIGIKP